jgi:hypothetical protein
MRPQLSAAYCVGVRVESDLNKRWGPKAVGSSNGPASQEEVGTKLGKWRRRHCPIARLEQFRILRNKNGAKMSRLKNKIPIRLVGQIKLGARSLTNVSEPELLRFALSCEVAGEGIEQLDVAGAIFAEIS